MLERDVENYSRFLDLSEAQRSYFVRIYEEYRSQCDIVIDAEMPGVVQAARRAMQGLQFANYGDETLQEYLDLLSREESLMMKMQRYERALFDQLQLVLADEQLAKMPRVTMHRQRAMSPPWEREIGAARVDLSEIAKDQLSDDILKSLDPLLQEYERTVTPLVASFDKMLFQRARDLARVTHSFQSQQINDIVSAIGHVLSTSAQLQRRMALHNKEFFDRMLEELPARERYLLRKTFFELAYPEICNDSINPFSLYEAVVGLESLSEEERSAARDTWEAYCAVYDSLSDSMAKMLESRQVRFAQTRTPSVIGFENYRTAMRSLRDERWSRTVRFIDDLEALLRTRLPIGVVERIVQFRKRLEAIMKRAQNDHFPEM